MFAEVNLVDVSIRNEWSSAQRTVSIAVGGGIAEGHSGALYPFVSAGIAYRRPVELGVAEVELTNAGAGHDVNSELATGRERRGQPAGVLAH